MKNLLSKQYFLSVFVLLLAMCQSVSQLSAVTWGNYPGRAGSSYLNLISQPGQANAQLLGNLARNISIVATAADAKRLVVETTESVQVGPEADGSYFIPKASTPAYQQAATPGIQAVADALSALNATVLAKFNVANGTTVALTMNDSGVPAALQALGTKLSGDFLKVYNERPEALAGIPAVVALTTQTKRLTNVAELCTHAADIQKAATDAFAAQNAGDRLSELVTRTAAVASAAAEEAQRLARIDGAALELSLAGALFTTIDTRVAAAKESMLLAQALNGAVAGAPEDAVAKAIAKPLSEYAAAATTTAATITADAITQKYVAVTQLLAPALKSSPSKEQTAKTLHHLTQQLENDYKKLTGIAKLVADLTAQAAVLKCLGDLNIVFTYYMPLAIRDLTPVEITNLIPENLLTKAQALRDAAVLAQAENAKKPWIERTGLSGMYNSATDWLGSKIGSGFSAIGNAASTFWAKPLATTWSVLTHPVSKLLEAVGLHYGAYVGMPLITSNAAACAVVPTIPLVIGASYGLYKGGQYVVSKMRRAPAAAPAIAPIVVAPAPVIVAPAAPTPGIRARLTDVAVAIRDNGAEAARVAGAHIGRNKLAYFADLPALGTLTFEAWIHRPEVAAFFTTQVPGCAQYIWSLASTDKTIAGLVITGGVAALAAIVTLIYNHKAIGEHLKKYGLLEATCVVVPAAVGTVGYEAWLNRAEIQELLSKYPVLYNWIPSVWAYAAANPTFAGLVLGGSIVTIATVCAGFMYHKQIGQHLAKHWLAYTATTATACAGYGIWKYWPAISAHFPSKEAAIAFFTKWPRTASATPWYSTATAKASELASTAGSAIASHPYIAGSSVAGLLGAAAIYKYRKGIYRNMLTPVGHGFRRLWHGISDGGKSALRDFKAGLARA